MRVTEGSAALGTLAGLQATASRLAAVQSQLSSGKQITKPSDSPVGTTTALGLRGELKRMDQYTSGATDALGWLTAVDESLSTVVTQIQKVQTLVLSGSNTGANDASAREAMAQQVDHLRTSLISLANSQYLGRPIFAGTTIGGAAYDDTGTYAGNTGTVNRAVGPSASVDINTLGTDVFGPDGANIFTVLTTVSNDLRTNTDGLATDLSDLSSALSQVSAQQSIAGAKFARIKGTQGMTAANALQLKSQLSDIQDIDVADMAIKMATADAAYQASLATTAKVRQNSLLDFLR